MRSALPPGYEHLEGLLFVTTEAVRATETGGDAEHPQAISSSDVDDVESIVGDRLVTIPGHPVDAYEAADAFGPILRREDATTGVVILGDYGAVPSRPIEIFTPDFLRKQGQSNPGNDRDAWRVWTDDLYGDRNGDTLAELPVSRIPIVPKVGGILGDKPRSGVENRRSFGLRASEFTFADTIYGTFGNGSSVMLTSPNTAQNPDPDLAGPWDGPSLKEGDLAADHVYLVLHGLDGTDMQLKGTLARHWVPIAVTGEVVGGDTWESRGLVFSGACWGGLTADPIPRWLDPGETAIARPVELAFPLEFLDRGANAVVAFTGAHYIPRGGVSKGVLGAPLHCAFWKNVAERGWPPALALFQARARFIAQTSQRSTDPLALAQDMKTFWSATCLGLGW